MKLTVDTSEVRELAIELGNVSDELTGEVKRVVSRGALNIKNQLRDEMKKSSHFKAAHSISYDLTDDGLGAEIGPVKGGAGSLANIAYFGGRNGGGGTVPDPKGALEAEEPKFMKALADLAVEVLS